MFCLGGFCPGGFWQGGFLSRGFLSGGLCRGVFVRGVFVLEPMEQVKLEEFNLKWHEIHGILPPNLYTATIIHKAAYSGCETISPVVKQFHACNKNDDLQLRSEPPLHSIFALP